MHGQNFNKNYLKVKSIERDVHSDFPLDNVCSVISLDSA
jgi:hypothetical protein